MQKVHVKFARMSLCDYVVLSVQDYLVLNYVKNVCIRERIKDVNKI